jgi:hypothetical protein
VAKKKQAGSDEIIIPWDKEEDSGGGGIRVKEGDYKVKIVGAKHKKSSEKETPYIELKLKLMEGKKKGKIITERVFVTPKSVGRVRMLLKACGVRPPKKGSKATKLNLKKLIGKVIGVSIEDDEEYKGTIRSRVAFEGFMTLDDLKGADEDDDEDEDDDSDDEESEDEESDDDDEDDEEDEEDEEDDDDVDELDLDDEL